MSWLRVFRHSALASLLANSFPATRGYPTSTVLHGFFTAMLRSELPGVKISDATIRAFTSDAVKGRDSRFVLKLKLVSMAGRIVGYRHLTAIMARSFRYERLRRELLTQFLFSTDFFAPQTATERELTYLGPTVECRNPFAIRAGDSQFTAVEIAVTGEGEGQVITFWTNVGEVVEAGPKHPIRFEVEAGTGGIKPYVHVRGPLEALLTRPVTYELLAHGEEVQLDDEMMFAVRSNGAFFPIMPALEVEAVSR